MTKKYFIPLFLFCLIATATAFSQAKETTVKFQDAKHPAFTNQYNFPPGIVLTAIQQRLKHDGLSTSRRRDVISGLGVNYSILTPEIIDLYFQVEGHGRKGKGGSTVNLLISRGKDNFVGGNSDPKLAQNAMQYLDNLRHDITLYGLQQEIKQQQKSVDSNAGDYKKLLKSTHKLESRRYDLQKDLSGETDSDKQNKIRKKIDKLDKDIHKKQVDMRDAQRNLQDLKSQLNNLQDRLNMENQK